MPVDTTDTMLGATFGLSVDSLTLRIESITPVRRKTTKIKTTHLGSAGKHTYRPGELAEFDELVIMYQNSPAVAQPTYAVQTGTVTGPTATGASTPESCSGSGFIVQDDWMAGFSIDSEGLQKKQMTWSFDGVTGPTRTPSS